MHPASTAPLNYGQKIWPSSVLRHAFIEHLNIRTRTSAMMRGSGFFPSYTIRCVSVHIHIKPWRQNVIPHYAVCLQYRKVAVIFHSIFLLCARLQRHWAKAFKTLSHVMQTFRNDANLRILYSNRDCANVRNDCKLRTFKIHTPAQSASTQSDGHVDSRVPPPQKEFEEHPPPLCRYFSQPEDQLCTKRFRSYYASG